MSTCDHATDPCDVCADPATATHLSAAQLAALSTEDFLDYVRRRCAEKAEDAPPEPYEHPAPPSEPDLGRYRDRFGGR